jgi:acetoin:2,6-dichlorophenolindophenol oxidoreductase subunit alpha
VSNTLVRTDTGPGLSRLAEADLRLLLRIRHTERMLLRLFADGLVAGTTHTCLGQEYVPVAMGALVGSEDYVFSNHRGHGHYLAHTGDLAGLFAELLGRSGAPAQGVGGSQHLKSGRFLSTGVQGQSLPVAAGTALHLERAGAGGLCCVYIGDGTWGEGSVYEALNLASLWRLPLLVVVEHNGIAQSTPTEQQMAGTIAARAAAFGLAHGHVTGSDVNAIRRDAAPLVAAVRHGEPAVLEFRTRRLGPHSRGDDTRPPEEVRRLEEQDWYRLYGEQYPDQFAEWDAKERSIVEDTAAAVRARPLSVWDGR